MTSPDEQLSSSHHQPSCTAKQRSPSRAVWWETFMAPMVQGSCYVVEEKRICWRIRVVIKHTGSSWMEVHPFWDSFHRSHRHSRVTTFLSDSWYKQKDMIILIRTPPTDKMSSDYNDRLTPMPSTERHHTTPEFPCRRVMWVWPSGSNSNQRWLMDSQSLTWSMLNCSSWDRHRKARDYLE